MIPKTLPDQSEVPVLNAQFKLQGKFLRACVKQATGQDVAEPKLSGDMLADYDLLEEHLTELQGKLMDHVAKTNRTAPATVAAPASGQPAASEAKPQTLTERARADKPGGSSWTPPEPAKPTGLTEKALAAKAAKEASKK
jgi:hypothetical protein